METTALAYDDTGGEGPLVVLLPGAGDIRSGYRELGARLAAEGWRVVTADLPGHGDSPTRPSYGVAETAAALVDLIDHLDAGPAVVVGNSFSPAAAVWAATDHPEKVRALVAISPHMEADDSFAARMQRWAILGLLRGRLAAPLWARLYRSWYKSVAPPGLDGHVADLRRMLSEPARRRAARETLAAGRAGMAERLDRLSLPVLVMFGTADDHFPDPAAEAEQLAGRLDGEVVMVEGAGHYPQIERPDQVGDAILTFLLDLG